MHKVNNGWLGAVIIHVNDQVFEGIATAQWLHVIV